MQNRFRNIFVRHNFNFRLTHIIVTRCAHQMDTTVNFTVTIQLVRTFEIMNLLMSSLTWIVLVNLNLILVDFLRLQFLV